MRNLDARVAGDPVAIYVVEGPDDVAAFRSWAEAGRNSLGLDVETTGLNIYGGDTLRLVQFGDERSAFVLDPSHEQHRMAIADVLRSAPRLVLHNAPFDLLALDRAGLVTLEDVWPKVYDTRTMAHLLDPRGRHEGGVGHGLKELAEVHVGDGCAAYEKALKARFRTLKLTNSTGWAGVPLDDEDYVRYSAVDPVLTVRLFNVLGYAVVGAGLSELFHFEKAVALVTAKMQRTGIKVDLGYAAELDAVYRSEEDEGARDAAAYGIDNVNAPAQVAEVLTAMGAALPDLTASGQPKVDRAALEAVAASHGPAAAPAAAVLKAKRAGKFRAAYVEQCARLADGWGRVHPTINPLQARTARMSISDPPLQQIPSGDWRVRRLFVPSPECRLISVDYSQVEMRILAALSGDRPMVDAILSGEDLHSTAAALMFGDGFTDKHRKLAKVAGFAKVYGGGADVIARQTGVDLETARNATSRYDRAFPGIKQFGRRLQDTAEHGAMEVVTPSGRRLPLDADRLYAATNYVVQSTARDVMAQALLRLDDAGLADFLLLPIHDEVLAEAPVADAADIARDIAAAMEMDFMGVPLTTDAEVAPGSWGTLYGADR